jgi:hypothetical protein
VGMALSSVLVCMTMFMFVLMRTFHNFSLGNPWHLQHPLHIDSRFTLRAAYKSITPKSLGQNPASPYLETIRWD